MSEHVKHWKVSVERLVLADEIGWPEAARLATEIAGRAADALLRQAATQAIPILRNAAQGAGDPSVALGARRRLLILFDILQQKAMPRFGMRRARPKPLSAEERARRLLQLPLDKSLAQPEIRRAFRRAAKMAHPDVGGSEEAFRELIAAHEMLMDRSAYSHE
jgi:DnaJ domain